MVMKAELLINLGTPRKTIKGGGGFVGTSKHYAEVENYRVFFPFLQSHSHYYEVLQCSVLLCFLLVAFSE